LHLSSPLFLLFLFNLLNISIQTIQLFRPELLIEIDLSGRFLERLKPHGATMHTSFFVRDYKLRPLKHLDMLGNSNQRYVIGASQFRYYEFLVREASEDVAPSPVSQGMKDKIQFVIV